MIDQEELKRLPTRPGVYIMRNRTGRVLYVGKGKNLRSRVRQYYGKSGDGREMIPRLIRQVDEIETIVVASEKEALLLENTLIKEHQPKYNVLLKDDKGYVNLQITDHKWPLIQLVRYKGKPKGGGTFFGPYTNGYAAKRTLELLRRLFPLRQCTDQEFARRERPCLLYGMKRCSAPCVGYIEQKDYQEHVRRAIRFLRGQDKECLKELYHKMELASDAMEYELAAHTLETIRAVEQTVESQRVAKATGLDQDAFGLYRIAGEVVVSQLMFREGKLVKSEVHQFTEGLQEDAEVLESLLLQLYGQLPQAPHELLTPVEISPLVSELLSDGKRRKVHCMHPQRGEKKKLIDLAQVNAKAAYSRQKDEEQQRLDRLLEMQQKLRLRNLPREIECVDTSNIGGSEPVSCVIGFTDGKKNTKRYRLYKIKGEWNDYAAMHETLSRRYKKGDLPDLLIVDGGKGQLNIALKVLADLEIVSMDVIGLAKEKGRHDKGMTQEKVYLPEVKDPIILGARSPLLFLLQQIRDEAHRFAISFQKKRRTKRVVQSELSGIEGIGPVKQTKLLRHFGSVKRIRAATLEQLTEVEGIGNKDAQRLLEHFKGSQ